MPAEYTITITGMNRPHLFRLLLESLVANDLDGWRAIIRIEPTERSGEFEAIARELLSDVEYDLRVNEQVEGIERNPFLALEEAFGSGSKLNLYLEEDFVISPDVTRLARWYEREHQEGWFCLGLLAGPCGCRGMLSNAGYPDLLFTARTFNSIGFVMRREEWYAHAREAWTLRESQFPEVPDANWRTSWGWDWCLYGVVATSETLRTVHPVHARATNTGRDGGYYAIPDTHDVTFGGLSINEHPELEYRVVPARDLPHEVRSHVYMHDELTTFRVPLEDMGRLVGEAVSNFNAAITEHNAGLQREEPSAQAGRGLLGRLFRSKPNS